MILRVIPCATLTAGAICLSAAVGAQTVLGTAPFEGRTVELLSDNTWRFQDPGAEGACALVGAPISFCGSPARWQRVPITPSPALDALYQIDDRNFAMIIAEGLGAADGVTQDTLRETVLLNAGAAAGLERTGVPLMTRFTSTLGGEDVTTIGYQVTLQGLQFTYLTTLYLGEQNSAQLTTYAISETFTESHNRLHEEFLAHVQLAE